MLAEAVNLLEEVSQKLRLCNEQLSFNTSCIGSKCPISVTDMASKTSMHADTEKKVESTLDLAISSGLKLLELLHDLRSVNAIPENDNASDNDDVVAPLSRHAGELLISAILCVVEFCVRAADVDAIVKSVCMELQRHNSLKEVMSSPLPMRLRRGCDFTTLAERGWRWCDAHVTLRPDEEALCCIGDANDWWWRPSTTSGVVQRVEGNPFDNEEEAMSGVGAGIEPPEVSKDGFGPSMKRATVFLDALLASGGVLAHRIATDRKTICRLHALVAEAALQRASLLAILALRGWGLLLEHDESREGECQHVRLPWEAARDGLFAARRCLIAAATTARVGASQFGDVSCEAYCHRAARALGAEELRSEVEISDNVWRVTHGTGLVASKPISVGSAILRERPILLPQVVHHHAKGGVDREAKEGRMGTKEELVRVEKEAHALFRRVGPMRCAMALAVGATLGDPQVDRDAWAVLQLLSRMPRLAEVAEAAEAIGQVWSKGAMTLQPTEDFRMAPQRESMGRAMYALAAYLNHSCIPNALCVFGDRDEGFTTCANAATVQKPNDSTDGKKGQVCGSSLLCVVALRDIAAGEEVTVSYLPSLLLPPTAVQRLCGFVCRCDACRSGRGALLEGALCPACESLLPGDPPTPAKMDGMIPTRNGAAFAFDHAAGCALAGSNAAEISERCERGLRQALQAIHQDLLNVGAKEDVTDHSNNDGDNGNGKKEKEEEEEEEREEERYAQQAQKAMRALLDLDSFTRGLPSTHHCRLKVRLECLATSLNALVTPRDSVRLLQLCEALLDDLTILLPTNYPLLTGIRLHYCFARSREIVSKMDTDVKHDECCAAVRAENETVQLPFIQDAVLRQGIIESFQEYCARENCRFATEDDPQLLTSFLRHYQAELHACGIDRTDRMIMLSLMLEASEGRG